MRMVRIGVSNVIKIMLNAFGFCLALDVYCERVAMVVNTFLLLLLRFIIIFIIKGKYVISCLMYCLLCVIYLHFLRSLLIFSCIDFYFVSHGFNKFFFYRFFFRIISFILIYLFACGGQQSGENRMRIFLLLFPCLRNKLRQDFRTVN